MRLFFRIMRLFFLICCVALMFACALAWVFPGTTLLYPRGVPPFTRVAYAAHRSGGVLVLQHSTGPALLGVSGDGVYLMTSEDGRLTEHFRWLGLEHGLQNFRSGVIRELIVPLWMPFCAAFLTVLLLLALIFLRRRKHKAGHCPACSYDLRAHKPGQRCPECGALIPQPPTPLAPASRQAEGP